MDASRAPGRRRRVLGAVAIIGSVAALSAGCSSRGGMWGRTTTTMWRPPPPVVTTTTMGNGCMPGHVMPGCPDPGHGDDHGNPTPTPGQRPGGINEPPNQAQIDAAMDLVNRTRAANARNGENTVQGLLAKGFFSIGDEMTGTTHYVHNQRHYDGKELDPMAVEAYAARGGRLIAAMYILENGKAMSNIPNIAGNWTKWHDHVLPFQSANPRDDGYYKLGFRGGVSRRTSPMLHVWLVDNPCGPFAGTDNVNMTGSCADHGGH
jgi:hypothetical protein